MSTTTTLPTHPRTGLRALGILPSGRIVWPQLGGDETGSGGDGQGGTAGAGQQGAAGGDGGSGQAQQGQGQQNNGGQQAGQQGGQAPPVGPDGQPWDPARAESLIANLRQEIATLKGKQSGGQQNGQGQAPGQQQNQQGQQAQQQAGQAPADDGTAAKLTAATTELAIFKAAGKHGADPAKLTDSRSFMDAVGKLDPAAADYDKQVSDAIKKAVTDHPHYASGQAPGGTRGGSDGTGRPGAPNRPRTLEDAVAARMNGQRRT